MSWTPERIEQLKKLWDRGESCTVIGLQMGASRNSVISKVSRLKLQPRKTAVRREPPPRRRVPNSGGYRTLAPKPKPEPFGPIVQIPANVWHPITDTTPKSLAALNDGDCRWPISDTPTGDTTGFCGCKAHAGLPYCASHAAKAYQAPDAKRKSINPVSSIPALGNTKLKGAEEFLKEHA
jgi:GcrA cell cycle regulator